MEAAAGVSNHPFRWCGINFVYSSPQIYLTIESAADMAIFENVRKTHTLLSN
jgi:hypothetical protein